MNRYLALLAITPVLILGRIEPALAQFNLLVNGDFESGNTGFASQYAYSPGYLEPEGLYDVAADPHADHDGFTSFGDHTSGHGLMLCVNGAPNPSLIVWMETVAVETNTTYALSGWTASCGYPDGVDPAPANFVFSVNGTQMGNPVQVPATNAIWQSFTTTWYSGSATQAVIHLIDLQTIRKGNDFVVDDLVFGAVATNAFPVTAYRSIEIAWSSVPKAAYQVQWSDSLPATNWFNLGNAIVATGTNTSAWDRIGAVSRFYQVLRFQ